MAQVELKSGRTSGQPLPLTLEFGCGSDSGGQCCECGHLFAANIHSSYIISKYLFMDTIGRVIGRLGVVRGGG